MLGEWKIQLVERPGYLGKDVYLFKAFSGEIHFLNQKGEMVVEKENDPIDYEKTRFALMTDQQLQAFANALASNGIKTTNDSKNEGLLEAKNIHLEDMRKLVFKDKYEHTGA